MIGKTKAVVGILVLASACTVGDVTGPTATSAPPTVTSTFPPTITSVNVICSASNVEPDRETETDLPEPVAEMRLAIIEAAIDCNYERLADLALAGRDEFTYSFGGGGDPAEYWREAEDRGEPVMAVLVAVLDLSGAQKETQFETDVFTTIYVWPAAFADNPSDADWEEVGELYTEEEIASMKEFGGYIGYRVGTTSDGDWVFFVAGD
ncbi:MAG: hypothetical protein ACR2NT_09560 [Acidimicrobiia bacterium]